LAPNPVDPLFETIDPSFQALVVRPHASGNFSDPLFDSDDAPLLDLHPPSPLTDLSELGSD
ncbi:MAG TPA: hypothetical protein VNC15_04775, partial [Solirubrobacterales bacterium]|nr:hypothetical protein [Solirubrobacterales bacterium]